MITTTARFAAFDADLIWGVGETPAAAMADAAASRASIPMGRYGRVEEFAAGAACLGSAQASYVTGARIRCDGGMIRAI